MFAHEHGVQGGTTKQHMTTLLADVARVPGVASVASPYDASGSRQISDDGTVAYATVQFAKGTHDIAPRTLDDIRARASATRESTPGLLRAS